MRNYYETENTCDNLDGQDDTEMDEEDQDNQLTPSHNREELITKLMNDNISFSEVRFLT